MNGVIGSLSFATSSCIRWSRIMKFVADVSSSMRRSEVPYSSASAMFAACDVLPDASSVEKLPVSAPNGRFVMNGEMSTPWTLRPSSALILTASGTVATSSRPSSGT